MTFKSMVIFSASVPALPAVSAHPAVKRLFKVVHWWAVVSKLGHKWEGPVCSAHTTSLETRRTSVRLWKVVLRVGGILDSGPRMDESLNHLWHPGYPWLKKGKVCSPANA